MKIGICCHGSYGGSGVVASELALALAAGGDEVHVVSAQRPPRLPERDDGALAFHEVSPAHYALFEHPPVTLALANKLVEVAYRHELDVLHAHYAVPLGMAALLARQMVAPQSLPVVLTCHGTDVGPVGSDGCYVDTTRFSLYESDAVSAVSESLRKRIREDLDVDRPVVVIPNFVDVERFAPRQRPRQRRGPAVLVHVSNFRPLKRPLDVIEVFLRLQRRLDCRLVMVGDGPERLRAQERCAELGIGASVTWTGNLLQVEKVLQAADLVLQPSAEESFGVAALEAMACGVPVVATAVGGVPEVVEHERSGWLAAAGDVDALVEGAERLLTDPAWAGVVAARARERVLQRFTVARVVPLYRELYRQVAQPQTVASCR